VNNAGEDDTRSSGTVNTMRLKDKARTVLAGPWQSGYG
jgi:hypothetical protein